jgi:hypothetical protein
MRDSTNPAARNKQTVLDFWQSPPTEQPGFLTDDVKWHLPPSIGETQFGVSTLEGDEAKAIFQMATGVYEPMGSMDVLHTAYLAARVVPPGG